jgi:hypothetical protein
VNKPVVIFVAMLAVFAGIKASAETYRTVPVTPTPPSPVFVTPSPPKHYILPPAEYDHAYEGDLTIKVVATLEELHVLCKEDSPNLLACALLGEQLKSCIIILAEDEIMRKRGWTQGLLFRHEQGHCNGWGGDHAGQRAITWPTTYWVEAYQRVRIPPERLERVMTIKAKDRK